jgi:hypothetical protein
VERHDLSDDLDRRLRAARPASARVDEHAFDDALLARVRREPIAARRSMPRSMAVPIAATVIVVATAAVVLGGPGDVGGPSPAAAITQQTLRWLDPPSGTILHVRSVETSGAQTTTREYWQSADAPNSERELVQGQTTFESSGDGLYDPATNMIYDPYKTPADAGDVSADNPEKAPPPAGEVAADEPKGSETNVATPRPSSVGKPGDDSLPAGDPIVTKVRMLLQDGRMTVTGRELHDGVDAWTISLNPDSGRPVWTLWVSVADGKPLELRDPGRTAGDQPQVIRWTIYETLADDAATHGLLTLSGAHPSAQVVHDPAQAAAAEQRLMRSKP